MIIRVKHPMLDQEHLKLLEHANNVAKEYVEPVADKIDRENYYPRNVMKKLGDSGILSPIMPKEYGGLNADILGTALILEALAWYSGSIAVATEVQGFLVTHAIYTYGSNRHREEFAAKLAKGELIGSYALSEPCCGSDAAAIETRAERVGGEWVINGKKMWITQGLYADLYIVFARTGRKEDKHKAITAFLLRRSNCIETSPIVVMGIRGTGTSELTFNDCHVSDDDVIGKVNDGFKIAMEALNLGRIAIASISLGLSEAALVEALNWLSNRNAFGGPLLNQEWIQFQLADIIARIEAIRSLTYEAASRIDKKFEDYVPHASMAKLIGAMTAVDISRRAIQLTGAFGISYSKLDRIYRDAKLMEIGEGTNEVQMMVIYKWLQKLIG
jgi:alkylation response protein AidB-like acyl-CoA dehydrogenase